jgi:hypothetical protein
MSTKSFILDKSKFDDSDPSDSDPRPIFYKKETYFAK